MMTLPLTLSRTEAHLRTREHAAFVTPKHTYVAYEHTAFIAVTLPGILLLL